MVSLWMRSINIKTTYGKQRAKAFIKVGDPLDFLKAVEIKPPIPPAGPFPYPGIQYGMA